MKCKNCGLELYSSQGILRRSWVHRNTNRIYCDFAKTKLAAPGA